MANIKNITKHIVLFLKNKPRVIPRIINGFFKVQILRKPVLRTIDWAVTYRCNAKCVMCSAKKLHDPKRKEMTLDERKMVWEQAKKLGVIHTQFTGGEPMVMGIEWLEQAIKDLTPKKFLVCMSTNAAFLTEEKIRRLKEAGMDTIQMSVDSLNFSEHDRIRGLKDNLDHIIKMAKYGRSLGMAIGMGAVVGRNNLKEMWKRLKFVRKLDVFLPLNPVSSRDNWETEDFQSFREEDVKEYERLLAESDVRSDTYFNFYGHSGCPSGERIYITAYGDVQPCPHLQWSFGNVREEPLKVIWDRLRNAPWTKEPTKHFKHCRWAFNKDFYKKYVEPYENLEKRPVSAKKVFGESYGIKKT